MGGRAAVFPLLQDDLFPVFCLRWRILRPAISLHRSRRDLTVNPLHANAG